MKRSLKRKPVRKPIEDIVVTNEEEKQSEIASKLGITPQAVSQSLKRGLRKFYYGVRELDTSWTPFQAALIMAKMLKQDESVSSLKTFIGLLPPDVKEEIMSDATHLIPELRGS